MRNKKIKILRIVTRLNIGGPAIHSILLTNALNSAEYESILVSGAVEKGEVRMDSLINKYKVEPIFIPELKREIRPIADLISFFKVCKLIKQHKPDIVHTHTAKAGLIGRLAAFVMRVPVKVHTFHGHTFYGYFNRVMNMIVVFIERMLAKITDVIIVISTLQEQDIVQKYRITNREKCRMVPLGLELDKYFAINPELEKKGAKEDIDFRGDDIIVGTVGRITRVKNHKLFLEIARRFYDTHKRDDVKFVIVGDGELKTEIINYRDELKLNDKVHLVGWQDDVSKFYSAFDIFVLTSKNEGTPVSMIEAMASGIPAVSTNVGGVPDLLYARRGGYLVDNFNKEEFVRKLNMLATRNPALRISVGEAARRTVRNRFNRNSLTENIRFIYEKHLEKKGIIPCEHLSPAEQAL